MTTESVQRSQDIRAVAEATFTTTLDTLRRYKAATKRLAEKNQVLMAQIAEERSKQDPRIGDLEAQVHEQGEQIEQLKQDLKYYEEELISWCALAEQHEQQMREIADDDELREAEELSKHG